MAINPYFKYRISSNKHRGAILGAALKRGQRSIFENSVFEGFSTFLV